MNDEPSHGRAAPCPFLGAWWDEGTQHSYATAEGRCYAVTHAERYLWILKREMPGGHIDLDHQKSFCFAAYKSCRRYIARTGGVAASTPKEEPEEEVDGLDELTGLCPRGAYER